VGTNVLQSTLVDALMDHIFELEPLNNPSTTSSASTTSSVSKSSSSNKKQSHPAVIVQPKTPEFSSKNNTIHPAVIAQPKTPEISSKNNIIHPTVIAQPKTQEVKILITKLISGLNDLRSRIMQTKTPVEGLPFIQFFKDINKEVQYLDTVKDTLAKVLEDTEKDRVRIHEMANTVKHSDAQLSSVDDEILKLKNELQLFSKALQDKKREEREYLTITQLALYFVLFILIVLSAVSLGWLVINMDTVFTAPPPSYRSIYPRPT